MSKLLQRLDSLANHTGIPQVYEAAALGTDLRRRPMRWLPILSIALGAIGIGMELFGVPLGQVVLACGLLPSSWMPLAGPVKPLGWAKAVDERDIHVRSAAYLATLPVILIVAIVLSALLPWRTYVALQGANEFDVLMTLIRMSSSAVLFLVIVWNSVPTLYASLKWPTDDEDSDD